MLRMSRGFARKLSMTSRQNQPTMSPISTRRAAGSCPVAIHPRGHLMKSLKLIGLALGASFALSSDSAGTGHLHRSGGPDDGRRIRIRPADEERRRTGGGGPQCRRRRARQEAGAADRRRRLRSRSRPVGGGKVRQRENPVRRRTLLLVVVDPGVGGLCRRQRAADYAGLDQSAVHRAQALERGAGLRP